MQESAFRPSRAFSAGAFGASALVVQTEYLRSVMVVSDGGTLAVGAALAAWLAVICAGSLAGSAAGRVLRRPAAALAVVAGLSLPAALFLLFHLISIRQALGLTAGLIAQPLSVFSRCLIACTPYCLCIGLAFPLLAGLRSTASATVPDDPEGRVFGSLWASEALGAFVAGLVFTFVLAGWSGPVVNVLAFGSLPILACLAGVRYGRRLILIPVGITLIVAGMVFAGRPLAGHFASLEWQGLGAPGRLVSSGWSRYGSLSLAETEGQYTLYDNGTPRVTFPDPYTDLSLAALVLCQDPDAERVIVAGPCCGGLAQTLLRAKNLSVLSVYPDSRIEKLVVSHLPDSLRQGLDCGDYSYVCADLRAWLGRPPARARGASPAGATVLLVDLPGPYRMEASRLYTAEFFRRAARALGPAGGVLALRLPYAAAYALDTQRELAGSVWSALGGAFRHRALAAGPTELILYATDRDSLLSEDNAVLLTRLAGFERSVSGFSRYFIAPWFEAERLEKVQQDLTAAGENLVQHSDQAPVAWFQHLRLSLRLTGERQTVSALERVLATAGRLSDWERLLLVLGPVLLSLLLASSRLRTGSALAGTVAAVLGLGLAGLASMGAVIVLQYTCQLVFGTLFQQIGLLTAVYMLALAMGSWAAVRAVGNQAERWFGLPLLTAGLALSLIMGAALPRPLEALWALGEAGHSAAMLLFYLAVALTGFCSGALFPGVARFYSRVSPGLGPAIRAGRLNAADHLGAALGAFLVGVIALPAWGPLSETSLLALGLGCLALFWRLQKRKGK